MKIKVGRRIVSTPVHVNSVYVAIDTGVSVHHVYFSILFSTILLVR